MISCGGTPPVDAQTPDPHFGFAMLIVVLMVLPLSVYRPGQRQ